MMPTSAELRARARESLTGYWGKAATTTLLYAVMCFIFGLIYRIQVVGWIVELLVTGPIVLGLYAYFLGIARKEEPGSSLIFSGFKRFIDAFLLCLLMGIFTFLWSLLLIVPGIIAYFRYKQSYYILKDNPQIGPLEAIRRSKEMMKGHKWRLFVLYLTFIGWYILGCIPLGIGLLWVIPYIQTAAAHFHDDLKSRTLGVPPAPVEPGSAVRFG